MATSNNFGENSSGVFVQGSAKSFCLTIDMSLRVGYETKRPPILFPTITPNYPGGLVEQHSSVSWSTFYG